MHPIGIALGFLIFWSLVAAGAFLVISAAGRLRRVSAHVRGGTAVVDTAMGVAVALHVITALLGATLIAAGLYATYVVVLAR